MALQKRTFAPGVSAAAGIALGALALIPFAASAQTAAEPSYCTATASSTMGYFVTTDMPSYSQGQTVNFCLADNTRSPLFLEGTHPWEITDQNGNAIYTPAMGELVNNPQGTSFFVDSWNGQNASSTSVAPGTYQVVFPGFPGTPSATFTIVSSNTSSTSPGTTGTLTGTVSSNSTTSTSTTTPPTLGALISALQNLQGMFPNFSGWIQGLINELLGSGTTVGNTAPASIDQSGKTFSAGGSIDFGGRNFGHEESVTVSLNGQAVATAHADGGGNFSTGSLALPATPGSYTYTFTGQNSGISIPATITVQ